MVIVVPPSPPPEPKEPVFLPQVRELLASPTLQSLSEEHQEAVRQLLEAHEAEIAPAQRAGARS